MDDLIAFLAARLDEDEAAARAATPGPWIVGRTLGEDGEWQYGSHIAAMGTEKRMLLDMNTGYTASKHVSTAKHIARHDPARVLREVEAKRAILDRHMPHEPAFGGLACDWCSEDVDDRPQIAKERWPCPDVLSLAAVWGDHPDYRPEWKP